MCGGVHSHNSGQYINCYISACGTIAPSLAEREREREREKEREKEERDPVYSCNIIYTAIFTRDLRFICDGNPDYLKNGLINLHKRRQVFAKLEEIKHYQSKQYNFEPVPALQDLLQNYKLMTEDELHALSRSVEQDISTPSKLAGRPRSNSISSLTNIVTLKPPLTKMTVRGNSSGNLFL